MTVIRYEPWALVNRLHQQLDRVFGDTVRQPVAASATESVWTPRVDVYEEAERFVVLADVPGVEPKDIDITAEDGVLTLRGARRSERKASENGFARVERVSGSFVRRFTLPEGADTGSITAKQANGVLEIAIPKQPQAQPRRIEVAAA
jgi:HSP20 family protein